MADNDDNGGMKLVGFGVTTATTIVFGAFGFLVADLIRYLKGGVWISYTAKHLFEWAGIRFDEPITGWVGFNSIILTLLSGPVWLWLLFGGPLLMWAVVAILDGMYTNP